MIRLSRCSRIVAGAGILLWFCAAASSPARSEDARAGHAEANAEIAAPKNDEIGISSNPAATNSVTGTGWLGDQLGINKRGVRLGGVWIGGVNDLLSGGLDPGFSFNSSLVVDMSVDLERFAGLKGSSIGVDLPATQQPSH